MQGRVTIKATTFAKVATYHVIAHRNEQIKEQESAGLHLHLHSAAPLEGVPAPDDQS